MQSSSGCTRLAVIMAGGAGERFWPLSRRDLPKQLVTLAEEGDTLLGQAVARIAPLVPLEHLYIATSQRNADPVRAARLGVPEDNILVEPVRRNTAGCILYAVAQILARLSVTPEKLSMAVTTADHLIGRGEQFRHAVHAALEAAERFGVLATHGIVPTRPETGYGYVQAALDEPPVFEENGVRVYRVRAFHEKPDGKTAESYVGTSGFFWNSGMFFWRIDILLAELAEARPDMTRALEQMSRAMAANDKGSVVQIFESLEDISIDYALMEHAARRGRVAVTAADYPWDDVGSLDSLARIHGADAEGNTAVGDPLILDSRGCIVFNAVGDEERCVAVHGMRDVAVIVTEDAVLVIPRDRVQEVRAIVKELMARGSKHV